MWRGPDPRGGLASFGLRGVTSAGIAIVSILQDRKVSFHIGYIYILSIRWEEHAVSFLLSFIDCGYRFPGDALIVEWIDIESALSSSSLPECAYFPCPRLR
jgi:hypothetical protein